MAFDGDAPSAGPVTTASTLAEVRARAERRPSELSDLSTTLVFGEGPETARLMIVGEAPGEDEDATGRPFVGRAGRLLDQILASVDIDREATYVTNLVKYRPPGNRNPRPDEIAASASVLLDEMRIVRPHVVLTLGNVPTQWLLDVKDGITKLHGTWHERYGRRVMPIFHPAYLLRNPSRDRGGPKWRTWQAMQEVAEVLGSVAADAPALHLDDSEQRGLFG